MSIHTTALPAERPAPPKRSASATAEAFRFFSRHRARKSTAVRHPPENSSAAVSPSSGSVSRTPTSSSRRRVSSSGKFGASLPTSYRTAYDEWKEATAAPPTMTEHTAAAAADPPRPAKPGFEWVWFPVGYWAEREAPKPIAPTPKKHSRYNWRKSQNSQSPIRISDGSSHNSSAREQLLEEKGLDKLLKTKTKLDNVNKKSSSQGVSDASSSSGWIRRYFQRSPKVADSDMGTPIPENEQVDAKQSRDRNGTTHRKVVSSTSPAPHHY